MNKKIKLTILSILALVGLFASFNTVSARTSDITCDSAVIYGTIQPNGRNVEAWFEWGTNRSTVQNGGGNRVGNYSISGTNERTVSYNLTNLQQNTTYYYRLVIRLDGEVWPATTESFTTLTCQAQTYTVSTNVTSGSGYFSPTSRIVTSGNTTSFNLIPGSGYSVGSASGCNGYLSGSTFYTGNITSNCTVSGNFTANQIPNPTVDLTANPTSIPYGGTSILAWNSNNATSCSASWTTSNTISGTKAVSPTSTTTYSITCYGANGTTPANDSVTVNVQAATCQDPNANNYGGRLPCTYSPTTCQDPSATNYGGALPCRYPPRTYTVSTNVTSGNGSFSPTSRIVTSGNTTSFNLIPGSGYSVGSASGCGGYLSGSTYYTGNITSNCTVSASFTAVSNPNPSVRLTADNTNVTYNGSTTLRWNATNATSCSASGASNYWYGNVGISGSWNTGALTNTTTYNITCYGASGTTPAYDSVTVNVDDNNSNGNISVNLRVDDSRVDYDDSTTVRWSSNDADYCRASSGTNGWSGSKSISGSFYTGRLTNTTTYRITCYDNNGDSEDDSVTVYVDDENNNDQRPTVDLTVDNANPTYNGSTYVRWYSNDATSCSASGGINSWSGSKNLSGSFYTGPLIRNTTFYITCRNNNGSATDSLTIYPNRQIIPPPVNNQPTVVIYADSTNLAYNGATSIRWGTVNTTSCSASNGSIGWAGTKSIGPGSFYTGSLTSGRTYTITCNNNVGSSTDSVTVNVRGQIINPPTPPAPTSLVLITSSVDRNQPIVPTIDNTRPKPGDEINYTVSYQNIGTGAITNLTLRMDLPYEVDYMFSNPSSPTRSGNTLIFNLGTLRANGEGVTTVRVRVRDNIPAGTSLNFPAILSYVDPSGFPQSVTANVSAQVWSEPTTTPTEKETVQLGALAFLFGSDGFLPNSLLGWLLLILLIVLLVLAARKAYHSYGYGNGTNTTTISKTTTNS